MDVTKDRSSVIKAHAIKEFLEGKKLDNNSRLAIAVDRNFGESVGVHSRECSRCLVSRGKLNDVFEIDTWYLYATLGVTVFKMLNNKTGG